MFEIKESRAYYFVLLAILALAFFLRLFLLDIRPFHSDEGVNYIFMDNLINRGTYDYDPENYHGPILYYLTLIPLSIWGLETSLFSDSFIKNGDYAFRFWPMILGFGVILILIPLKRWLKWSGLLAAMALVAVSPTAVYYSRDNIHEMYLMFFTAAAFVCGYLFFTKLKDRYLYIAAASLALMFSAKETTMVTLVVWCLSAICASTLTSKPLWIAGRRFSESLKGAFNIYKKPFFIIFFIISVITLCLISFQSEFFKKYELIWYTALISKGITMMTIFLAFSMLFKNLRSRLVKLLVASVIFFILLSILFSSFFHHGQFSSFLKNDKGIGNFFKAFEMWTHQGTAGSKHTKSFDYYFKILYRFEKPILIMGILGIILAFWKRTPPELFTAFFAIGIFLAFSFIPYKTPWCVQNIMFPLFILSGIFIRFLFELTSSFIIRCAYVPIILVVLFSSLKLSADVNFLSYDNDSYEIVYVQTVRSTKDLVQRIDEISRVKFDGYDTKILMASPDNLPLNWYMRKYDSYWIQKVIPDAEKYSIIIANRSQERELDLKLKKKYQKEKFPLRPGIPLILYYQGEDRIRIVPEKYRLTRTVDLGEKEARLKPGIKGKVFQHIYYTGKKLGKRIDKSIDFRFDTDAEKPYPAPFSIVWSGYLKAPKSGDYIISTTSDDGSLVYIDNNLIVDNGGEHGVLRRAKEVFLSAGYHKIVIKYFDLMGGAIMKLSWKIPSRIGEKTITDNNLFHIE